MEVLYDDLKIGEKYGIITKRSPICYDITGKCLSYNKTFSTFEISNIFKKYLNLTKYLFGHFHYLPCPKNAFQDFKVSIGL